MPLAAGHAAPEIEQAIAGYVSAMNSRYTPSRPKIYEEVSRANTRFIFNAGPWMHKRELGSAGTFIMRACPEGAEYSEPVSIEGVVEEPYPMSEIKNEILTSEGRDLIGQILGIGPHVAPGASLLPFGVFESATNPPAKRDVAEARARLQMRYAELVREAGDAWADNRDKDKIIQPKWHHVAARALKKTDIECPWMTNSSAPESRKSCPSCGTVYIEGVAECAHCGDVLNEEAYMKKLERKRAIEAKVAAKQK